jgi:phosphatidylserine decarboxylase
MGEEIGRFNMGSTVVLLFASPAVALESALAPGAGVRLGQAIARG